jgi:hypothetical protein
MFKLCKFYSFVEFEFVKLAKNSTNIQPCKVTKLINMAGN